MAKNWSMKEATKEILAGNKEAIVDVGRRFPLTANAIAKMGNNEGAITIINALPEHISARKIESVLKDGVQEIEDDEVEEVNTEEEPSPVGIKKEKPAKKEKVEKPAKAEKKAKKNEDEDFMNDIPEEVDEELNLEAMSEVELFKLAKKKGLKPAPKQKKQYYIDLLNPTDDSDDWDDEEEEEKPAKKEKKAKKEDKPAKKEKKAAKKDDDEEDDWDI